MATLRMANILKFQWAFSMQISATVKSKRLIRTDLACHRGNNGALVELEPEKHKDQTGSWLQFVITRCLAAWMHLQIGSYATKEVPPPELSQTWAIKMVRSGQGERGAEGRGQRMGA